MALRNFHELGYSHLALTPYNIWIEDMFYVYLGPSYIGEKKITIYDQAQERLFNNSLVFFPPEITFGSPISDSMWITESMKFDTRSDLWS